MNLIEIILLAFALGIDCCVVSFSQGLIFTSQRIKNSLLLAIVMGLFQGYMPVIGYIGADSVSRYAEPFSKWLVFAIFLMLGLKFILEAFRPKEQSICCIGFKCLMGMGIATSIDALVAGASLNLSKTPLFVSAVIIGAVSFIMSLCGFWLGNVFKKFPPKYLEIAGGVILLLLAVKSVI